MPPPRSILIERFKRLPRRSNDAWQGGLVRARTLIDEPSGGVRRPWAAVWVSLATGMINIQLAEGDADADLALQVLVDLGLKFVRCRPARLEVADATLGARLAEALADPELEVSVRADLPAVDQVLRTMEAETSEGPPLPEALEVRGVTVDRMRAFAEAAREFYEAAPWQHLSGEDFVHVEAPAVASGLRHFTVLGAAGNTFGLGFFAGRRDFEAVHASPDPSALLGRAGKWTVFYGPVDEMPFGDADLWEDQRLPVAGPSACLVSMWYGPRATCAGRSSLRLVHARLGIDDRRVASAFGGLDVPGVDERLDDGADGVVVNARVGKSPHCYENQRCDHATFGPMVTS